MGRPRGQAQMAPMLQIVEGRALARMIVDGYGSFRTGHCLLDSTQLPLRFGERWQRIGTTPEVAPTVIALVLLG